MEKNQNRPYSFNNKGFSLTEVLIALLILSIVSISLFFILSTTSKSTNKNKYELFAAKFAEEKIIFIKHNKKIYSQKIKYDTVPSLKEKISDETINWKITDKLPVIYNMTTEIKIENSAPLLLHIWITVKWEQKGKEKKYILESYL